jgi:glycosyltransferase involved in cell wall biosynthesis
VPRASCSPSTAARSSTSCTFWAIGPGGIGAGFRAVSRVPLIVHVMGGETVALPEIGYGGGRTARGRAELRWALAAATVRCAGARALRDEVAALAGSAELVPLGVDAAAWPPAEPRRRAPGAPLRLVHVASLNRVKDQATLLRACALLAQDGVAFTLDVIGEDTLGGAMQRLAASLGLNSVRFHGFLPQREAQPIVAAADVFVLSSLHDAAPVAVLEAAMVGVPTVGTRVGHVADLAPAAAVAVAPANPDELAAALAALARDEERRLALARAAQDWARRHDAEFAFTAVNAIYRRVASRA